MPRVTMTVHGNAFCSEQFVPTSGLDSDGRQISGPILIDSGLPRGWGRTFFLSGWYHVAIPNITHYDGEPMYLDEVLILMTRTNMRFDRVDMWVANSVLWTGPPAVENVGNLLFRPRDSSGQRMQVRSGFGVSMFFTNTGSGSVTFNSAAATLQNTP